MAVKASSMSEVSGSHCPVCRKPSIKEHRPFCSKRCGDIDLARWLGGGYVIAGSNIEADEDATGAPAAPQSGTAHDTEDNA